MGAILFRNNTGIGWVGSATKKLPNGLLIIENPRPFHAGLCTGSSDLIGWMPTVITKDMVGQKIAIFLAAEVKSGTKPTAEQLRFIHNVREAGGIAGVTRSQADINQLISQYSLL